MSLPGALPQVLDFFGTPLVIKQAPPLIEHTYRTKARSRVYDMLAGHEVQERPLRRLCAPPGLRHWELSQQRFFPRTDFSAIPAA
jgi:hypothetical protein